MIMKQSGPELYGDCEAGEPILGVSAPILPAFDAPDCLFLLDTAYFALGNKPTPAADLTHHFCFRHFFAKASD